MPRPGHEKTPPDGAGGVSRLSGGTRCRFAGSELQADLPGDADALDIVAEARIDADTVVDLPRLTRGGAQDLHVAAADADLAEIADLGRGQLRAGVPVGRCERAVAAAAVVEVIGAGDERVGRSRGGLVDGRLAQRRPEERGLGG